MNSVYSTLQSRISSVLFYNIHDINFLTHISQYLLLHGYDYMKFSYQFN